MKSKSRRKQLEGKVGEMLLRQVQRSLLRKHPEQAEKVGERIGRVLMSVDRRRRERCLANLELAFPEMPLAERETLCRKVFEHFGRVSADFLQIPRRTEDSFRDTTEVVGLEHLHGALSHGKGVLMVTGHFGNWERCSTWVSMHGYKLSVVARDADDMGVNTIVNDLRRFSGAKVISRGNAARPIIEALRRNEVIGILPDQNSDEAFLPFFGKLAGTVLGPGVIHERTGAPVLPVYGIYLGAGRYRIEMQPVLEELPGYEVRGEGMMRAINANLEAMIRRHPEQWLWFHDRWKNARRRGLI